MGVGGLSGGLDHLICSRVSRGLSGPDRSRAEPGPGLSRIAVP